MTNTPKGTGGDKGPEDIIIELVDRIDWRFVALAALAGVAVAVIVLAMIEHSDDASPQSPITYLDPTDEG